MSDDIKNALKLLEENSITRILLDNQQNQIKLLQQKCGKLKRLLLLTDENLLNSLAPEYHISGGVRMLAQWQEFIKEFPDEA